MRDHWFVQAALFFCLWTSSPGGVDVQFKPDMPFIRNGCDFSGTLTVSSSGSGFEVGRVRFTFFRQYSNQVYEPLYTFLTKQVVAQPAGTKRKLCLPGTYQNPVNFFGNRGELFYRIEWIPEEAASAVDAAPEIPNPGQTTLPRFVLAEFPVPLFGVDALASRELDALVSGFRLVPPPQVGPVASFDYNLDETALDSPFLRIRAESLPYESTAWQCWDVLLFTEQTWKDLNAQQRLAHKYWEKAGGVTVILDAPELDADLWAGCGPTLRYPLPSDTGLEWTRHDLGLRILCLSSPTNWSPAVLTELQNLMGMRDLMPVSAHNRLLARAFFWARAGYPFKQGGTFDFHRGRRATADRYGRMEEDINFRPLAFLSSQPCHEPNPGALKRQSRLKQPVSNWIWGLLLVGIPFYTGILEPRILKRLGRRNWTWVTLPIVMVALTSLLFLVARNQMQELAYSSTIRVVDIGEDGQPIHWMEASEGVHHRSTLIPVQGLSGEMGTSGFQICEEDASRRDSRLQVQIWSPYRSCGRTIPGAPGENSVPEVIKEFFADPSSPPEMAKRLQSLPGFRHLRQTINRASHAQVDAHLLCDHGNWMDLDERVLCLLINPFSTLDAGRRPGRLPYLRNAPLPGHTLQMDLIRITTEKGYDYYRCTRQIPVS